MLLFSVLKNNNYKMLYFAGLFSDIGTFVTETVFVLFIFGVTHFNNAYLGLFKAVYALGMGSGMIVGSVVGTKIFKKHILMTCELSRIPLILILFLYHPAWFVIASFGVIAFFTGAFSPNRQALINYYLSGSEITEANSLFSSTYALLYMIGPLLGASIYAKFNHIYPVLYFDLFTYLIGIYCLIKMDLYCNEHYRDIFKKQTQSTFLNLSIEGFKIAVSDLSLRTVLINALSVGTVMGITSYLLLPYSIDIFHRVKTDYGLIMAFLSVGGVLGGILGKKLSYIFNSNKLTFSIPFLEASMMIITVTFTENFYIWLLLVMFWGTFIFVRIFAQMNFVSRQVPTHYIGRVHAILNFIFIFGGILGASIVVMVGKGVSAASLLQMASVFLLTSLVLRAPFPGMMALFHGNQIFALKKQAGSCESDI